MNGVVEVRTGRVRGVERQGVWSFSGIPYAASPARQRRWRPPAPPETWTGIRDCDHFGPVAPQTESLIELSLGRDPEVVSEDCLSLNIWTPATDAARRPVMVWIHGGSFLTGSGSGGLYRGGMLARDGDVVVVTINYRLGALGFLAHPALEEDGQEWIDGQEWSGSGNWGLADQVAALHWVREHIHIFGGDPDNVTLFGESAGGMSVASLLGVDEVRGLFRRVIVQSGPPYTASMDDAANLTEKLAAHLGVALTRAELEQVPFDRLVEGVATFGQTGGSTDDSGLLMKPVVDGGLLPRRPELAVEDGAASEVPMIIGTTRDESTFFALGNPDLGSLDEAGLRRWMRHVTPDPDAGARMVEAVREIRRTRGESITPLELWNAIATEHLFRVPSLELADAHLRKAAPGVGTYCYLFTWESPAFGGALGSCHAIDLPFVFGTVHNRMVQNFSGGGDDAFALSGAIRAAWTAFARTGSPADAQPLASRRGPGSLPGLEPEVWSNWDPDRRPTTVLGPWPGSPSLCTLVDAPRNEEASVVATLRAPL
ncbi:MAG: carboxylesterase family protein [Acidimicrobiales bacterium]